MGILGGVGSVLGDVGRAVEGGVNDVVRPLTGGTIGQDAASVLGAVRPALAAVGNRAVTAMRQPAPTYGATIDPNTGAAQITRNPSKPSRGQFFKNLLTGALRGMAASTAADSPSVAAGLGAGFAAQQKAEQQQDALAQANAEQRLKDEMEGIKLKNYDDYLDRQGTAAMAKAFADRQEGNFYGEKMKQVDQTLAKSHHDDNELAGFTLVKTFPDLTAFHTWLNENPAYKAKVGELDSFVNEGGQMEVWDTGTSLDRAAPEGVKVWNFQTDKDGNPEMVSAEGMTLREVRTINQLAEAAKVAMMKAHAYSNAQSAQAEESQARAASLLEGLKQAKLQDNPVFKFLTLGSKQMQEYEKTLNDPLSSDESKKNAEAELAKLRPQMDNATQQAYGLLKINPVQFNGPPAIPTAVPPGQAFVQFSDGSSGLLPIDKANAAVQSGHGKILKQGAAQSVQQETNSVPQLFNKGANTLGKVVETATMPPVD